MAEKEGGENKVYFNPALGNEFGLDFMDKRSRNPNWTDTELKRFIAFVSEKSVLTDLSLNFNREAFTKVAKSLAAEGIDKTWETCRVKLKNLRSQYRYVKERIPHIDDIDLEDEEAVKALILEHQAKGVQPSHLKHVKYLMKFYNAIDEMQFTEMRSILGQKPDITEIITKKRLHDEETQRAAQKPANEQQKSSVIQDAKKRRVETHAEYFRHIKDSDSVAEGRLYGEKLSGDMMEQFQEFQKRYAESYVKMESERFKRRQSAIDQWRQEAMQHQKALFEVFASTMATCNNALHALLKAKHEAEAEIERIKSGMEDDEDVKGTFPTRIVYTAEDDDDDDYDDDNLNHA